MTNNNKLLLLREIVLGILETTFLQKYWKTRGSSWRHVYYQKNTPVPEILLETPIQLWEELPLHVFHADAPWEQALVTLSCFQIY